MTTRKTKIICTIGPSSRGVDRIAELIESGMDAARLNFSHGTHEEHERAINEIREASKKTGKEIAIIQDLQGPKIRIGEMPEEGAELTEGDEFVITGRDVGVGDSRRASTTYEGLPEEVEPGKTLLLDDGYIVLEIRKVVGKDIRTRVVHGGRLKSRKGIVAPMSKSAAPSLSEKDVEDLKCGLSLGVDYVALSFVRNPRNVMELRAAMKVFGRIVPIISKIEQFEGVQNIDEIIEESDAIMVARGDLGLEMPAEDVPILQKEIIDKCNYRGKPVVTATQMLESMIENSRPTRAEASDVANAALDGSDCVMLSGETSVGKYPIEAVRFMDKILRKVEKRCFTDKDYYNPPKDNRDNISDALGKASVVLAEQATASAIVAMTSSGFTAVNVSKYRPEIPIIALADKIEIIRRLSLVWGIIPKLVEDIEFGEDVFEGIAELIGETEFLHKNDYLVFVAGLSEKKILPGNMLKIYRI